MNTLRFLALLLGSLSLLVGCQGSLTLGGALGDDPSDGDGPADDDDGSDDDDAVDDDDSPFAGQSEGYMVLERWSEWSGESEVWCEGEIEFEVDADGSLEGYADCELDWGGGWGDDEEDDWNTVAVSVSGSVSNSAEIACVVEHALGWSDELPTEAPCAGGVGDEGWFIEWDVEIEVSQWNTRDLTGIAFQD